MAPRSCHYFARWQHSAISRGTRFAVPDRTCFVHTHCFICVLLFNIKLFRLCGAMLCTSAAYAVVQCLSVCPWLSVTFVNSVKMSKQIFKLYSPSAWYIATPLQYFRTKRHGNIPAGIPLWGRPMQLGIKNRDFRPIFRFISEMIQDRAVTAEWKQETVPKFS